MSLGTGAPGGGCLLFTRHENVICHFNVLEDIFSVGAGRSFFYVFLSGYFERAIWRTSFTRVPGRSRSYETPNAFFVAINQRPEKNEFIAENALYRRKGSLSPKMQFIAEKDFIAENAVNRRKCSLSPKI